MKILPVREIAFYGQTGDDRSPESFPFPAAMTSMMEYLGEDVRPEMLDAHGQKYLRRGMNIDLVAAGGIGFALLWDAEHCPSAQELLQAAPYEKGIDRMFAYAGWGYERVTGEEMKAAAVKAIDGGRPLIALGPPLPGRWLCQKRRKRLFPSCAGFRRRTLRPAVSWPRSAEYDPMNPGWRHVLLSGNFCARMPPAREWMCFTD